MPNEDILNTTKGSTTLIQSLHPIKTYLEIITSHFIEIQKFQSSKESDLQESKKAAKASNRYLDGSRER
jgi:hypothetical protein